MSTDTTYPTAVIDGTTIQMLSKDMVALPTQSELQFHPSQAYGPTVVDLTGMAATQIDETLRSLPENFHNDGQKAAVPGRARNLVKSAIEDGWIVSIEVAYRKVRIDFWQPAATVMSALRDLLAEAIAGPAATQWENRTGRFTVAGTVVYRYDSDAQAMRVRLIQDLRLLIGMPNTRPPMVVTRTARSTSSPTGRASVRTTS